MIGACFYSPCTRCSCTFATFTAHAASRGFSGKVQRRDCFIATAACAVCIGHADFFSMRWPVFRFLSCVIGDNHEHLRIEREETLQEPFFFVKWRRFPGFHWLRELNPICIFIPGPASGLGGAPEKQEKPRPPRTLPIMKSRGEETCATSDSCCGGVELIVSVPAGSRSEVHATCGQSTAFASGSAATCSDRFTAESVVQYALKDDEIGTRALADRVDGVGLRTCLALVSTSLCSFAPLVEPTHLIRARSNENLSVPVDESAPSTSKKHRPLPLRRSKSTGPGDGKPVAACSNLAQMWKREMTAEANSSRNGDLLDLGPAYASEDQVLASVLNHRRAATLPSGFSPANMAAYADRPSKSRSPFLGRRRRFGGRSLPSEWSLRAEVGDYPDSESVCFSFLVFLDDSACTWVWFCYSLFKIQAIFQR